MREFTFYWILLICVSCNHETPFSKTINISDDYFNGTAQIEKVEKINKYRLTIKNSVNGETDKIYTPYEIFAMESGDINHDGKTDICIGIIKPTPFDSLLKKRLFIFQIDNNFIRPLWLSSRLVYPLEEFVIENDENGQQIIKTIERQSLKSFCINEYKWKSFGMSFISERNNMLSYTEAITFLKNKQ